MSPRRVRSNQITLCVCNVCARARKRGDGGLLAGAAAMFVMIYIINFYCLGGEFVESGIYSKP
jgi:hypothetical protein